MMPSLKEAKKRTNEDINILRNEYVIPDKVKNIGLNKEIDITDVICLQVYLALKQIAKTRIIDSSRLSKEQLEIYNTSMDIKEIGGNKYGR